MSGTATAACDAWIKDALGLDPAQFSAGAATAAAPAPGANGAADAQASGAAPTGNTGSAAATGALPAADYVLYFDHASPSLTADDTKMLGAYAQKYLQAQATDKIQVDGYASVEGADGFNQQLSQKRAQAVMDYLVQQHVPADRIVVKGHGSTAEFSKDDLRQNRRATLAPELRDAKAPPPPDAPKAQPPINLKLTDEQLQKIVGDKPCTVSRDDVEKELADFLTKLAAAQKTQSVKVTDRVRLAGNALTQGNQQANQQMNALLADDRFNYNPKELAHKMAALLPDQVPCENVDKFRQMQPKDINVPGQKSVLDLVNEKIVDPVVKKITGGLPESVQKKALELAHSAVEKGVSAGVKAAAKDLGLDSNGQDALEKAVEAGIKEKGQNPQQSP
ncbi:MAG: OmpA family protein [Alphaproteobacteria bacterium]|nr:OmpA family protein [Alphaproteobacteria bacterium]